MSTAWKYKQKVIARKQQEKQNSIGDSTNNTAKFELLTLAIEQEVKNLHDLPNGTPRIERKKALIAQYFPEIEKYINSKERYQNDPMIRVMIWCFDIGDIEKAMQLARLAILQRQKMPENFKRDIFTAVADFVYDWVKLKNCQNIEPYFSEMYKQVMGWNIHDEIKIKYIKVAITVAERNNKIKLALDLCYFAEAINPELAKVKTKKEKYEKIIANPQQ